ncbi:hypothetical protein [Pricia sp.]|uniref:hypothetical protein n=1 Tax=Pricia sp. TaxID=2268138 RepID=UPI00359448F6
MTKIRKFFGIGRKPRKKRVEEEKNNLPENFIVGSTNQRASEENRLKLDVLSKSDARNDLGKKKALR